MFGHCECFVLNKSCCFKIVRASIPTSLYNEITYNTTAVTILYNNNNNNTILNTLYFSQRRCVTSFDCIVIAHVILFAKNPLILRHWQILNFKLSASRDFVILGLDLISCYTNDELTISPGYKLWDVSPNQRLIPYIKIL